MSESADIVKQIFCEALDQPPHRRAAFLDWACGRAPELRDEVERLLGSHRRAEDFLETPALRADACATLTNGASRPEDADAIEGCVGRYRLKNRIGVGGMGVVYLAEQDSPRRAVAVKLLRARAAGDDALRRFRDEADVLGRLHHPGIAQVLEAGVAETADGPRPYFAMELVRGRPLTDYAAEHRLGTPQRLELLALVCDAVQHAHNKGVIHRDLKPANILVDESGRPKVLDFGVARLTASDVQITTLHTDIGKLIGTIPYMSPEQVAGDPNELDTRSDVYALGVIGYELLTGRLPHELTGRNIPEALRIIREVEPPPASRSDRILRGDVDTILSKALEKDKARRYQSALQFASDIRRHLRDEPIEARRPTSLYQFRKFARRNRALVAGGAIAVLGLLCGTAFATWQAVRATQERNRAVVAAGTAERIAQFLQITLASADPLTGGPEVTVREALDRAASRVDIDLAGEPEVRAAVHHRIGGIYARLRRSGEAERHHATAVAILRGLSAEGECLAGPLTDLAWVTADAERSVALFEEALDIRRSERGPRDPYTVNTMSYLATALKSVGRYAEAEKLLRDSLALLRELRGDVHEDVAYAMFALAGLRSARGDAAEAERLYRGALAMQEQVLHKNHPQLAVTLEAFGAFLNRQGAAQEAGTVLQRAAEIRSARLGYQEDCPPHPSDGRTADAGH